MKNIKNKFNLAALGGTFLSVLAFGSGHMQQANAFSVAPSRVPADPLQVLIAVGVVSAGLIALALKFRSDNKKPWPKPS